MREFEFRAASESNNPFSRPVFSSSKHSTKTPPAAAMKESVNCSESILVVNDHFLINTMMTLALMQLGLSAKTAESGREAISMLEHYPITIVFLDLRMPGLDGIATTKAIRELDKSRCQKTCIIGMTADAKDKQTCLDAGMDDYFSLPFTQAELQAVLHRIRTTAASRANPSIISPSLSPP